jgi:GTPase SAR1 family protein
VFAYNIKKKKKMSNDSKQVYTLNIILLGDPTVGKTSLVNRFVDGTFSENTKSTVRFFFNFAYKKSLMSHA